MNVDVRPMKTGAERALAEIYAAAKDALPGDTAVHGLRDTAFHRFESLGLPNRRLEEWKYTDLRALMREARPLAGAPDADAKARAATAGAMLGDIDARRIVFVNGTLVAELSDLAKLEPGLTIRSAASALASGDPALAQHIGKAGDGVLALNTALMSDGVVIHVAAGAVVERPIHLVFATPGDAPVSIYSRSLVVIEKAARVMLIEHHDGPAGVEHQVNTAMDLMVGDGSHVDHVKIVGGGDAMLHVASLRGVVGANARFNSFSYATGGALVRNQISLCLEGEGTVIDISGASLLKGRQHVDNTLVAEHKAEGCQSRETFKSVLDGASRAVFQGKIIVRPKAQKTDAKMMTQALLLSEDAEADNKPELEIFADDVQCGHGATAGALDENLRFYLMARGIPEKEAESLLIQAFVGEAVEAVEHAGLREALMGDVAAWLKARGE
jgi:Fe-S cluster assembly protein SufD